MSRALSSRHCRQRKPPVQPTVRPATLLPTISICERTRSSFSATQVPEALRLLEEAIERDPHYGPALALAAICYFRFHQDNRSVDPEADGRKSADLARRALRAAGDDPAVLANAALALAYFGEDIRAMTALVDRALALNPSFARGWRISGLLSLWAGQLDIAIELFEASLRLSPRVRPGNPISGIGSALFLSGRLDEAVPKLRLAIEDDPNFPIPYRSLAACYAHMGRLDDARAVIDGLRKITPQIMFSFSAFRNPEHRELLVSGLRLAMGEEP